MALFNVFLRQPGKICRLVLFISAFCVSILHASAQEDYTKMQDDILTCINEHRTSKGLNPLVMNDTIIPAAIAHSKYLAFKTISLNHDNFEERMYSLMKQLKRVTGAAENVADGKMTAKEVVAAWLNSPGHRENIEGNYNITGIGVVKNKQGVLYYTQIFLYRKP